MFPGCCRHPAILCSLLLVVCHESLARLFHLQRTTQGSPITLIQPCSLQKQRNGPLLTPHPAPAKNVFSANVPDVATTKTLLKVHIAPGGVGGWVMRLGVFASCGGRLGKCGYRCEGGEEGGSDPCPIRVMALSALARGRAFVSLPRVEAGWCGGRKIAPRLTMEGGMFGRKLVRFDAGCETSCFFLVGGGVGLRGCGLGRLGFISALVVWGCMSFGRRD